MALVAISGCGELGEDDYEGLEQPTVYGTLNVERVDEKQSALATVSDSATILQEWRWLSFMRAGVWVGATCTNPEGNLSGDNGSGVLVGPSVVMTADHVVRAWKLTSSGWDGCSPNESLPTAPGDQTLALYWAWDRENSAGDFADGRPPHRWLLSNRIHALSLFETNDFDPGKVFEAPPDDKFSQLNFGSVKSFGGGPSPANRDVAIITTSLISLESSELAVPPGLFFDWLPLPDESEVFDEATYRNQKIRGLHVNRDPHSSAGGNWDVDFTGSGTSSSAAQIRTPLLSGNGYLRKRTSSSSGFAFGKEPCVPGVGYGDFCVGNTLDVLKGSSGGGVLFDQESALKLPKVVAILHGQYEKKSGNGWSMSETSYFGETTAAAGRSGYATVLDSTILGHSSLDPPQPGSATTLKVPATPRTCEGRCVDDALGKMVNFSCAEAFKGAINPTNSVDYSPSMADLMNWVTSNGLGIVGGPTRGDGVSRGQASEMIGVGSLGLVCDRCGLEAKDRNYAFHWGRMLVVGLFRRFDALVVVAPPGKVTPLMELNQGVPLEFVKNAKALHRPLPMKMCPPGKTLTGLRVDVTSSPVSIKSVTAIRCTSVGSETTTWYKTNPLTYTPPPANAQEFIQHLGAPLSTAAATSKDLVCNPGEILTGLKMYVPDNQTMRDQESLKGLGVICQGGLL